MTARDVIAEMRKRAAWLLAMRSGLSVPSADCVAREAEALTSFADRLESTLAQPATVDSLTATILAVIEREGLCDPDWADTPKVARVIASALAQPSGEAVAWRSKCPGDTRWLLTEHEPTVPCEKRALYDHPTTPPAPLGGLTEGEREALAWAAEVLSEPGDSEDAACARALQALACRLTAPRAEGVDEAVNRFLCWKLPQDFAPDAGIRFTPTPRQPGWAHDPWPVGTNLFNAAQARAMFEHCLPALTAAAPKVEEPVRCARCGARGNEPCKEAVSLEQHTPLLEAAAPQAEGGDGVTEAMAKRYLEAQRAYLFDLDQRQGRSIGAIHTDHVIAACMAGLAAALAPQRSERGE
jgi:hypothetical protein